MKNTDNRKEIRYTDLTSRAAPKEGEFRVISQNSNLRKAWIVGTYTDFADARLAANDAAVEEGVASFIHNVYNRVMYSAKD